MHHLSRGTLTIGYSNRYGFEALTDGIIADSPSWLGPAVDTYLDLPRLALADSTPNCYQRCDSSLSQLQNFRSQPGRVANQSGAELCSTTHLTLFQRLTPSAHFGPEY